MSSTAGNDGFSVVFGGAWMTAQMGTAGAPVSFSGEANDPLDLVDDPEGAGIERYVDEFTAYRWEKDGPAFCPVAMIREGTEERRRCGRRLSFDHRDDVLCCPRHSVVFEVLRA